MIEFGEWKPDLMPLANDGLTVCTNVIPSIHEYLPVPSPQELGSTTLTGTVTGGIAVRGISDVGVTYNFIGTISKIYLLTNNQFSDVSIAGGYSGQNYEDRWEFAQVGNDIIATNFVDAIQTYTFRS